MNQIYYDLYQATCREKFVTAYGHFLKASGEQPVTSKQVSSMDEVLQEADVEAIFVNCSRGPVINKVALVEHLKHNPMFSVGLDVIEDEPYMKKSCCLENRHCCASYRLCIKGTYFLKFCIVVKLRLRLKL
ncbi:putative glycerate dehydrogenase [Helianthus debilis subsp. tardiflorus]